MNPRLYLSFAPDPHTNDAFACIGCSSSFTDPAGCGQGGRVYGRALAKVYFPCRGKANLLGKAEQRRDGAGFEHGICAQVRERVAPAVIVSLGGIFLGDGPRDI